jgi:hypothetical protein
MTAQGRPDRAAAHGPPRISAYDERPEQHDYRRRRRRRRIVTASSPRDGHHPCLSARVVSNTTTAERRLTLVWTWIVNQLVHGVDQLVHHSLASSSPPSILNRWL